MVSFGNASGAVRYKCSKNVTTKRFIFCKTINATIFKYQKELDEASNTLFEKINLKKLKLEIFKKYKLEDVVQAHKDLEKENLRSCSN